MSNLSSPSSGASNPLIAENPHTLGVPIVCWCGSGIRVYVSKTPRNTYRRFFRCETAGANRLQNDDHIFKWFDEALADEIRVLTNSVCRLEIKVDKMERGVEVLMERVEKTEANVMAMVDRAVMERVEEVLMERVEQVLMERVGGVADANSGFKKLIIVGVGVVAFGMMMFLNV